MSLPAGSDPGDLGRKDPAALQQAVKEAKPFLGFRIDRVLASADLSSPERRARAAEEALAVIAEHPSDFVRDQYVMTVAGPTRLSAEQLRQHLDRHLRGEGPMARRPSRDAVGTGAPFARSGPRSRRSDWPCTAPTPSPIGSKACSSPTTSISLPSMPCARRRRSTTPSNVPALKPRRCSSVSPSKRPRPNPTTSFASSWPTPRQRRLVLLQAQARAAEDPTSFAATHRMAQGDDRGSVGRRDERRRCGPVGSLACAVW